MYDPYPPGLASSLYGSSAVASPFSSEPVVRPSTGAPYRTTTVTAPQAQEQPSLLNTAMQGISTYQQLAPMFGSAAPAASGSAPIAAGAGQMSATAPVVGAGQVGGAGGSGASSALAAAGPWAALAALIIGNETYQKEHGNRPDDTKDYIGELANGRVLERDAKKYLGSTGRNAAQFITPHGQWDMTKTALKKFGDLF